MKNWDYFELKNTIFEAYEEFLMQKTEKDQAISRVFEDFYFYPEDHNRVENFITMIQSLLLRAKELGFVYQSELNTLHHQRSLVSDELLHTELNKDEVLDLKQDDNRLRDLLKSLPVKNNV